MPLPYITFGMACNVAFKDIYYLSSPKQGVFHAKHSVGMSGNVSAASGCFSICITLFKSSKHFQS